MKEILVLCPFGVDKGLLSKAAQLSDGALRVLIPAGEAETAAEYEGTAAPYSAMVENYLHRGKSVFTS